MIDDQEFLAQWNRSHGAVFDVAMWLRAEFGMNVRVTVPELRPDASVRHAYADSGDIECIKRIEVKHRTITFTGRADYPFPTVFVAEKYTLDRMDLRTVEAFVILSADKAHAAIVSARTRKFWVAESRADGRDGKQRTFIACPVEHVVFMPIKRTGAPA